MRQAASNGNVDGRQAASNGNADVLSVDVLSLDVLRLLIEAGAIREVVDWLGRTPAHETARNGHADVLRGC